LSAVTVRQLGRPEPFNHLVAQPRAVLLDEHGDDTLRRLPGKPAGGVLDLPG
jgi:hypothetical protein